MYRLKFSYCIIRDNVFTLNSGGWTLAFGIGLEYNRTNSFWNGQFTNDNKTSNFNGFIFPIYNTTLVLNYIKFSELLMFTNSSSYSKFRSQNSSTTWVQKKANSENIVGLIWNYNCVSGGYTSCNYILGAATGIVSNGDNYAFGLGLTGGASSVGSWYGTFHQKYSGYVNCGKTVDTPSYGGGCNYSDNYASTVAIGKSGHRYISETDNYKGLLFR